MITTLLSRERDRRLRWVERHPDQVNSGDVRRLLARELPSDQLDIVCGKARDLGVRPFTMWMWIRRFDVHTLALAVAADLTHAELLSHLGTGVAPDVDSLRVFAAINGLPEVAATPAPTPAPTVAAPVAPVAKRLTKLPEITDPGGWPFETRVVPPAQEPPNAPGPGSYAA